MSKKDKIMGVLSLLFFVGAGYVLYTGLFKKTEVITTSVGGNAESSGPKNIGTLLPQGTTLDMKSIEGRNKELGLTSGSIYPYPTINASEVGVPAESLMSTK